MKTISKLSALTLLIALFFTGCEKDPLQPDKNALRISKISDNMGMVDPYYTFVYDEGLLTHVLDENGNADWSITYNDDNLPVSIYDEYDEVDHVVEYDENGFSFSWVNKFETGQTVINRYDLDSDGRIINGDEGEAEWFGEDSLVISGYGGTKFDVEHPHPFYSIPLPLIQVLELRLSQGDFRYSNKFCPIYVDYGNGDDYYSFDYEYNEDGYPIRSNGRYGDSDGIYRTDTYFFEYETD